MQPQPPPCERVVRRGSGAACVAGAFTGMAPGVPAPGQAMPWFRLRGWAAWRVAARPPAAIVPASADRCRPVAAVPPVAWPCRARIKQAKRRPARPGIPIFAKKAPACCCRAPRCRPGRGGGDPRPGLGHGDGHSCPAAQRQAAPCPVMLHNCREYCVTAELAGRFHTQLPSCVFQFFFAVQSSVSVWRWAPWSCRVAPG